MPDDLVSKLRSHGCAVDRLSRQEREAIELEWQAAFPPSPDRVGRLGHRWIHRNALELYREEQPAEFYVVPERGVALRCRGGRPPVFTLTDVRVWPTDLMWTARFRGCDLEYPIEFLRREPHVPPA